MFESKYSKSINCNISYCNYRYYWIIRILGYDYYQNYVVTKDTSDFVDNFGEKYLMEKLQVIQKVVIRVKVIL